MPFLRFGKHVAYTTKSGVKVSKVKAKGAKKPKKR
jgi:hypothetical protein